MPPIAIAAVAAGAAIAGGVAGAIERSNASNDVKALMKQRLAELEQVGMPPDTSLPLILQEFKQQGVITPELEKQIHAEASKVAQIKENPQTRDLAMRGLQLIQQRAETGFGPEEIAALNVAKKQAAKEAQGRQQAILQNMQARGMGGSGAELAAQLSSAQAADEELSASADRIAAEKAAASRQAVQQLMSGASNLRAQDFGVAETKARAEDELNRFNVTSDIARQKANIAAKNRAAELNLSEKQRIADANIAMANAEQARQNAARESVWKNKLGLAGAKGDIYNQQAAQRQQQGEAAAQGWAQMGQGVAGAVTGIGGLGGGARTAAPTAPMVQAQPTARATLGVDTTLAPVDDLENKYPWLRR